MSGNKQNKVKFNISNAHYALLSRSDQGVVSFGTPVAVPGSVSVTLNTEGEQEIFWADGVKYYIGNGNSGYSGDWVLAHIIDKMRKEILNELEDEDGVMFETQEAEAVEFAFGFQIDGDRYNSRFWFYDTTAGRPNTEASTNEGSKTPQTDSLPLTMTPIRLSPNDKNTFVRARTGADTDATVYSGWFSAVVLPDSDVRNTVTPADDADDEEDDT